MELLLSIKALNPSEVIIKELLVIMLSKVAIIRERVEAWRF